MQQERTAAAAAAAAAAVGGKPFVMLGPALPTYACTFLTLVVYLLYCFSVAICWPHAAMHAPFSCTVERMIFVSVSHLSSIALARSSLIVFVVRYLLGQKQGRVCEILSPSGSTAGPVGWGLQQRM